MKLNNIDLKKRSIWVCTILVLIFSILGGGYLVYAYFDDDITLYQKEGPEFINWMEDHTGLQMPESYREMRYRPIGGFDSDEIYQMRFKLKEDSLKEFIEVNDLEASEVDELNEDFPCHEVFTSDDDEIDWWQPTQLNSAKCVKLEDNKFDYEVDVLFGRYSWEEERTLLIYLVRK